MTGDALMMKPQSREQGPLPRRHFVTVSRTRGFTLLEMLVALVIMVIGISLATIALRPDPRGVVREEGNRLALLLDLASEEAALGGSRMAWVGQEGGYEFQVRELTETGPAWRAVTGDDLLHPRQLPNGVYLRTLRVDDQPVGLGERVALGTLGAHDVSLEIVMGDARATVTGSPGQFISVLKGENGR